MPPSSRRITATMPFPYKARPQAISANRSRSPSRRRPAPGKTSLVQNVRAVGFMRHLIRFSSRCAPASVRPGDDPDEMLREDPPALPDDERVGLAEMAAVDQELRARAIEVRAGVGHDT